jgi:glycerol-3-phosphate dehydrogenase
LRNAGRQPGQSEHEAGRFVSEAVYDIAVIGGGINGAGIARDAAGRGAKVILLERGDLARGTSSASTKLIHGGLRYLEYYEFALVRESLMERERLWQIAPHIIWPMRFVLPYQNGIRPRWLVRLGLFLYDHIGGRKYLPATRSVNLEREATGKPLTPGFKKGFEYSDCWVDDARLVMLNAVDAARHGAEIRTRTEVTGLERQGAVWAIELGGQPIIKAKIVVNAAGPAVLELLARTRGQIHDPKDRIRLVRGSHIVVAKMFDTPQAYFCQNADGRIFFAIPYEDDFTLIGTTDADHIGPIDHVTATPDEIAYLCRSAAGYFRKKLNPADVIYSYAGVRPLVDDGSGRPEAASRGYHFDVDAGVDGKAPILSVFGGKITTYRHLAESAVAELAPYLPLLNGNSWTASKPLPGGDFAMTGAPALAENLAREYPFLDAAVVRRLVRSYGTISRTILSGAKSVRDLGHDYGHGLFQAEVDYLRACEWARTVEDILWRRTKLGLRFSADQVAALDRNLA